MAARLFWTQGCGSLLTTGPSHLLQLRGCGAVGGGFSCSGPSPNPWQLFSDPGKGKSYFEWATGIRPGNMNDRGEDWQWGRRAEPERGSAEGGPGWGGKSWAREDAGQKRLQKTALEVWVKAALTAGLGARQDQAGMKIDYLPILLPVTLEKGKKDVTKASMAEEDMMYLLTCASRKTLPGSESRYCGDFTSSGCLTFLSVEESGGHEPLGLEMSSDPGI